MGSIKDKVNQLKMKYDTGNPFDLAKKMGIVVRFVDLGSVLGFHVRHLRCSIIHINESATEEEQLFTCAHELGHAVLHPNVNTPFLKSYSYLSTQKIELEANMFAIELLFTKDNINSVTLNEVTEQYGIPEQFILKKFYY